MDLAMLVLVMLVSVMLVLAMVVLVWAYMVARRGRQIQDYSLQMMEQMPSQLLPFQILPQLDMLLGLVELLVAKHLLLL